MTGKAFQNNRWSAPMATGLQGVLKFAAGRESPALRFVFLIVHMSSASLCFTRRQASRAVATTLLCSPFLQRTHAAAPSDSIITLLEGDARLHTSRGSAAASTGLRIGTTCILHTAPSSKLLRMEWSSGCTLDLGADTRVLLAPAGLGDKGEKAKFTLYLLGGWAKLAAPTLAGSAAPVLFSPLAAAELQQGSLVSFVAGTGTQVWFFDESGTVTVTERPARGAAQTLSGGKFYSRTGNQAGQVLDRAPSNLLRDVPRAFRDPLPRRFGAQAAKPAPTPTLAAPAYAELRDWLLAESALRRFMASQFSAWARSPEFRAALLAREADHPEWAALLRPPSKPRL
jgi:hypothetical protein